MKIKKILIVLAAFVIMTAILVPMVSRTLKMSSMQASLFFSTADQWEVNRIISELFDSIDNTWEEVKETPLPPLPPEPVIESDVLPPAPPKNVKLIAVGDIMLSRTVADKIKQYNNIHYPFAEVSEWLNSADITFGNLENPITDGPRIVPYQMRFRADRGVEVALKESGFDVLSLANNHLPDFGDQGIQDTLDFLDSVGILRPGAGMNEAEAREPALISRGGLTFAFLAYNDTDVVPDHYEAKGDRPGTAIMHVGWVTEDVQRAKEQADFVIVTMHSGKEYVQFPNISQTTFAHAAIDAGAEMVIGHHPHVVQTMEKYNGKYIFYSLGNFIFDQDHSQQVRRGLGLEVIFDESGVSEIDFEGVFIHDYSQPRWTEKWVVDEIVRRLDYSVEEDEVVVYEFGELDLESENEG